MQDFLGHRRLPVIAINSRNNPHGVTWKRVFFYLDMKTNNK
jgi:hypothetical protein